MYSSTEKMHTESKKIEPEKHRGGKRAGAGRKPEGKERFTVTLDAENVKKAKALEANFSGFLDRMLANWLARR